jgi:copper resistance protein B
MKTPISKNGAIAALLILGLSNTGPAFSQAADSQKSGQTGHGHDSTDAGSEQHSMDMGMDHAGMDHSTMGHSNKGHSKRAKPGAAKGTRAKAPVAGAATDHSGMDHSTMDHSMMDHSNMAKPGAAKGSGAQPPAAGVATDLSGMDHATMDHAPMGHPAATQPAASGSKAAGTDMGQQGMDHSKMNQPGMDHSTMDHSGMGHEMQMGPTQMGEMQMGQMQMGPMQGGSPPPGARDPDAYAEGSNHAHLPGNEMNDEARFGRVMLDKLEYAKGDGEHGQNLDLEAWYGNDWDKLWLKAEGERSDGRLQSLRKEALWDHTIAPFWSSQLGLRHDSGDGAGRTWAALGVRGLAPYWFDTTATAYWRSGGGFAARVDVRYELLFTQQLILEPEAEANLYSKDDPARGVGSGLSDLDLSLRLRYEIRRQFAPYIGVTWNRSFGDTAEYARVRGERTKKTQVVAGVRIWF